MSNIIEYLICFVVGFVALCSVYVNGSQQPPLPLFHRYSALSVLPKNQQKLDNTVQNVKVLIHDVKEKSGVIVDLVQHGFHELQGKVASSASFAWKNTKLVERWQAVLASVDLHQDLTMIKDEQHTLSKQKENKNYFDKENIAHWWKKQSEGRSGLLVYLVPAFSSQYQLLRTAVPFCVDRMVQYMQPLNLLILSALSKPSGINLLRAGLWASIGLGGFKMLQDTYIAGSNWLPAHAQADSYAIVTGASSGLGKELARELFSNGYNLVLIATDKAKLEGIKCEFLDSIPIDDVKLDTAHHAANPSNHHDEPSHQSSEDQVRLRRRSQDIKIITCDLANPMSPYNILRDLKKINLENKIDVLVCNAGRGHYGSVHDSDPSELRNVIDINVVSTVSLVRVLLPRMMHRKLHNNHGGSRILIVSSIASAGPAANVATYSATKAFLSSFAQSLRRELLPYGLMVTLAQPGALKGTNFVESTRGLDYTPLAFRLPGITLTADIAARQIFNAMHVGHDMVTPGLANKFFYYILARALPTPILSSLVKHIWGPFPRLQLKSTERSNSMKGHSHSSHKSKNFRQKLIDFWFQPILDYEGMKRWWSRSKKGLGKGSNQTRQPDIAASTTDDGFEMEVQLEKRDAPEELEFDEREEEQDASDYFKSFLHGSHKVEGHQQHSESESYDPYNVEPMPPSMDYPDDEGTIESQCNENNSNVQDDEDAQLVFVPTMTNINDDHENGDESPLSTSPSSIKYWA